MVKWWDRLWGAVWVVGSAWIAYRVAAWFAAQAAPADLGVVRYGLIALAFFFGLLTGQFGLSVAIIAVTAGVERLCARLGRPLRPHTMELPTAPEAAVGIRGPTPRSDAAGRCAAVTGAPATPCGKRHEGRADRS